MPHNPKITKQFSISVPVGLHKKLKREAKRRMVSVSTMCRMFILEGVKK